MGFSRTRTHQIAIAVLALTLVFFAAACGSDPAAVEEPEVTVEEVLAIAGPQLAAISTAKFRMVDELQTGKKFVGTTLKTVEGDIRTPDGVSMTVDVEAPGMGFVAIEIVAVGEMAFMKFSRDAPWLPLPLDQVPFNFGAIGTSLSGLALVMENVVDGGRETIRDVPTIRIDGTVTSEDMVSLITDADPGHPITLSMWFDEADYTLRQFKILGRLFNDDAPETSRLVDVYIDVPVDVQLPAVATGS